LPRTPAWIAAGMCRMRAQLMLDFFSLVLDC
jgi:hypothetical protein